MHYEKKISLGIALILGVVALATVTTAQQQAPPLSVMPIRGDVYWTKGGAGGNTGIIVGKDGVIVVDAKSNPASAKEMIDAIAKLTPKPVTTVILTHSDQDHVNGLPAFPKGITIIAQENAKKEMEAAVDAPRNPAPRDYIPTKTVDKEASMTISGVHLQLLHWVPGHTGGDLVIYLPDQKIAFCGDLLTTNRDFPIVHLEKTGSSQGYIDSLKGILASGADTFVTGHGDDLETKAGVQKKIDLLSDRRAKIAAMVKDGKSLEDIQKALDEKAGAGGGFPSFTEVVYKELTKS